MSVVDVVPNAEMAALVVAWVRALADKDEETHFLCLETQFERRTGQAVRDALGVTEDTAAAVTPIDDPKPVPRVLDYIRKRNVRLLVTGPFDLSATGGKAQTSDHLVRAASCKTFALMYGSKMPSEIRKVLHIVAAQGQDRAGLRLVEKLRKRFRVDVTIGGIEDETGAKPGKMGKRFIRALLHEEALDKANFEIKVVVDRLKHRGVLALFDDHDLILTGWNTASRLRPLKQSVGDATAAVVKRTPQLSRHTIAAWLPRINPADHADLLHELRVGSLWNADFIGMLALASAIASLGLLQNSPAVVIGSMLLAPLMTPMIGLGLALGQADVRVMRLCGKSIFLGFLLTLAVSYLIGILTPAGATLSDEVLARGGPNVLDLFIAVFAAAAATFAMARPNISGAIAGVAIATALVPPVCAVGISLAHEFWLNAFGATTLFFTNLIAIIVTSSFTFSVLGITASRALPRYRRLAVLSRVALLVLLLGLAGPLSTSLVTQIERGKSVALAYPVTQAVAKAVLDRVAQDEGVNVTYLARPRLENRVLIHIASRKDLPPSYAAELRQIVRDTRNDPTLPVTVVAVRGMWQSDDDTSIGVKPE